MQVMLYFLFALIPLIPMTGFSANLNEDFMGRSLINDSSQGLMHNIKSIATSGEMIDVKKLKLDWPLNDQNRRLLTRFGTPTLIDITDPEKFKMCYLHEAVDIMRSSVEVSDVVYAPVAGMATVVYDGDPAQVDFLSYETAIWIVDDASKASVVLLHVAPDVSVLKPWSAGV